MTGWALGALIDEQRSACLCQVGEPNYIAAVCITPAGEDALWLVSRRELDNEQPKWGDANQPHEQLAAVCQDVYGSASGATQSVVANLATTGNPAGIA